MSSDELIASIEAAVDAAPRDVGLRAHLISLLVDAGRARDAVPHVQVGLELDPEHAAMLEMSVRVLEALGDKAVAYLDTQQINAVDFSFLYAETNDRASSNYDVDAVDYLFMLRGDWEQQ